MVVYQGAGADGTARLRIYSCMIDGMTHGVFYASEVEERSLQREWVMQTGRPPAGEREGEGGG